MNIALATVGHFFVAHQQTLMALLFWPAVSAFINYGFHKKTPQEWETWAIKRPVGAFFVEMCRANGIDVTKNLLLLQRLAARRAGKLPEDAWARLPLPPALAEALKDPILRDQLARLITPSPASTPPAPGA